MKDAQGRETQYEYNAAGDLTAVITPDGNRSETQYDAWGKAVSTTQGGLTRSMEYDAAGRVISLTNENGSHSDFSYDALDRLVQQGGFDGRTQRYHYDLTGKLTQSEDEGLVTLWHYDASDRITHRTVNGDPAEQWQYDGHGWLREISHLSEGHRVAVHYGYDDKGRLTGERQTVENPETGELLWQHETTHAYNEQGLANRVTPDSLPPVEWLTYGSGYLAGMKLGGTPLVEYTRDRLHRETVRSFGSRAGSNAAYELTSTYTPAGQLQSQHLNSLVYDRDYGWNDNGDLVRISGPRQTREYGYSATGRLESVRTLAPDLDIRIPYATDPAGNRLPDPELHPDSTLTAWPDNRIAEDAHYVYHYDEYGRLTEKTDRIPTGVIRTDDERTHHYHYDSQHRLVFHTRIQHGEPLVESRYLYDPLGRRMAKRVWRRERDLTGWMSLSRKPEETWYGWDGDRLTTVQTDTTRIQTVGAPTGVACSVCPGGITYANPVNPVLGAKVLPGETDLALPCPLPFILFRAYSSYRTRTPAPVGVFGPGWKAPFDIRLQIRDEGLILNDSGGRSIHFEPLFPGEISYSRSESLWLARGGVAAQHSSQPLSALWQVLPEDVRLSPHVYLATNSLQGPWWILSWPERVPGADEVLPPEPPAYRVLTGVVDGFGRTLAFHRAAEGDVAGAVTGVTDGAGRRFHLVLTTQAQRAEEARKPHTASLSSPDSPRPLSAPSFPDTLPAGTEYGADIHWHQYVTLIHWG
ncbi:putative RhsG core protein with extension [Escherichia coli 97.0246]|uniref:Putative RhsG core protein with extension n=1 Tax=Escherichia coli 97.0246 TaxID=869670 RepID=A0A8E0FQX5_ECOLX|nr:putative RhsG core protein with extension [Escherichia coli 97.0246]